MDWRSVKFDWNRARAFLVTAEEGSLSAAARALGSTQPTLGRQVDALEQELGVALFSRAGRGLALTPSGLELLDHVRAMGDAAGRVSLTASGQSQSIEGTVCITASEATAAYLLPPIIARLRRAEPGIDIEIVASNTPSDLRRREADIAIRNFRPTQPDLVAKKIKDVAVGLYASPQYLQRIGTPTAPADLQRVDFIGFDSTDVLIKALNALGLNLTPRNFPVLTENHLVLWEMVKHGVGVGVMPEDIGDAEPLVRRVLPGRHPRIAPLWLTAHRELSTSRRIRVVFDFLAEALAHPSHPQRP
ncbi:MAG: LysR family transcriptional regulator [Alphaproteobacteria bacterium]|nr:LysR family transcriptional regulator [Alphaproteobacteria bacterium]